MWRRHDAYQRKNGVAFDDALDIVNASVYICFVTHKRLTYTIHATQRMKLRGIGRRDVRLALATGSITHASHAKGKHKVQVVLNGETLVVHYQESGATIRIITVYFENR